MNDSDGSERGSVVPPQFARAMGRTIKVLRTDQGLGRREFAERAGISYSYLTEIENGDKPASNKVLAMVAATLGMRLHELIAAAETRAADFDRSSTQGGSAAQPPWTPDIAPPSQRIPTQLRWAGRRPDEAPIPPLPYFAAPQASASSERGRGSTPRSVVAVLHELQQLLPTMEPEDMERVLDLARRLAR
jgi:transcriptional regulator with XRE-family HTH domain